MTDPLAPPTRHEASAPATRHEAGPPPTRHQKINYVKGRPTRLEAAGPPALGAVTRLPPELAALLTDVRGLTRSGQSEPFEGTLASDGRRVFVKVYFEHSPPETALLDLLAEGDERRVTRVLRYGSFIDPVNGALRWWELQPFHGRGTLADRIVTTPPPERPGLAGEVLRELAEALHYCHQQLDHAHRDVKPANVLVRRTDPLELVLADFGSARRQTVSRHFSQVRMTELYAAPESLNGHLGHEQDWWALGMIVLEVLLGTHPYAGLDDRTVRDRLTTYDVPLDDVVDPRWRLALRGLLTRAREDRWGAAQVQDWLRGGNPAVVSAAARGRAHPPLDVDGRVVPDAETLAALFVDDPEFGQDWLLRDREQLADWISRDVGDTTWSVQPLRRPIADGPAARRLMASFVAQFAPSISPPRFRGHAADVPGLITLATTATAEGPHSRSGEILAEIVAGRLIGVFSRHRCTADHEPGCGETGCARLQGLARGPHLATIPANIDGLLGSYGRDAAVGAPPVADVAHRGTALALVHQLDPDRARADLKRLRRMSGPAPDWWTSLRDDATRGHGPLDGGIALALATVTLTQAQRQQHAAEARATAIEQEHRDRESERRHAERERGRLERQNTRRAQALRTHRTLTRWSVPILGGGAFLGLLELLRLIDPASHDALYAQVLHDPTFFLTRFYHYWYEVANRWAYRPPFAALTDPLTQRTVPWARYTVLAIGTAALIAMCLSGRLRRSWSLVARALFIAVLVVNAALVCLLLPEVVGVVGGLAFGVLGIGIAIAAGVLLVLVMAAGS